MMIPWFISRDLPQRNCGVLFVSCPVPWKFVCSQERIIWDQASKVVKTMKCRTVLQPLISDLNAYNIAPLINRQFLIFLPFFPTFEEGIFISAEPAAIAIASANKSDDAWKYLNWICWDFLARCFIGVLNLKRLCATYLHYINNLFMEGCTGPKRGIKMHEI